MKFLQTHLTCWMLFKTRRLLTPHHIPYQHIDTTHCPSRPYGTPASTATLRDACFHAVHNTIVPWLITTVFKPLYQCHFHRSSISWLCYVFLGGLESHSQWGDRIISMCFFLWSELFALRYTSRRRPEHHANVWRAYHEGSSLSHSLRRG